MFNDRYGLTQAVLKGRKTMTRRIIHNVIVTQNLNEIDEDGDMGSSDTRIIIDRFSRYKPGDVVAVAQSYKQVYWREPYIFPDFTAESPGWRNKMFVRADLMPHQIRITNVRIERLQDISDEDCLNEGVFLGQFHTYSYVGRPRCPFNTPRDAFASLIDRISGKGTWASNPWVFVYEFKLIS